MRGRAAERAFVCKHLGAIDVVVDHRGLAPCSRLRQLDDSVDEALHVSLLEVGASPGTARCSFTFSSVIARPRDDWNTRRPGLGLQLCQQTEAASVRKVQIDYDDVGNCSYRDCQALGTRPRFEHLEALALCTPSDQVAQGGLVLNQEDASLDRPHRPLA